MIENFICECPFCKEAAKWPKHNPYTEHNAHEEAVRAALHQAERDNIIKDEIIEDLRKKLATSEEKHKKATKMVKSLMKERNQMNISLRNRIEKVNELLVKNAELKKTIKSYEGELVKGSYISMSEYDNAIKERNVYKSRCTTYERLYDDVCKKYSELYEKFDVAVNECVATKLSNREKPIYRDYQLHKDNLKTIYKLEEKNKELKDAYSAYMHSYNDVCKKYDELDRRYNKVNREHHNLKKSNEELLNELNKFKEIASNQRETIKILNKFYDKCKEYDDLEQKYWDAQRLIDKYAQSEEKMKEYLNALTGLYFDECVKTRKDCPMFGGFRGGKIFGDHGETGDSEML